MCIVLWGGIFNKCQVGHFNESIVQILYVFTNFHSSINKERGVLKLPTITVDLSFFSLSSTSFIYFDTVIKWIRIWDVCILPTNWMLIYCKFFLFFIDNIPCLEIYFDAYTVISVFLSLRFIWYIFPSPLLLIYYFSTQFLENSHNWVIFLTSWPIKAFWLNHLKHLHSLRLLITLSLNSLSYHLFSIFAIFFYSFSSFHVFFWIKWIILGCYFILVIILWVIILLFLLFFAD